MKSVFKVLTRNPFYKVDENGNVYSLRRNHILTPKINHDGYLRIQLYNHGKCEFVSIHRLVAEEFVPNLDNKPFVNHLDGDKQNNHYSNLEWVTQSENIQHAWITGLSTPHFNPPKRSRAVDQFDINGAYIATYPSTMEVERCLHIKHGTISSVCKHKPKYYTAGGYKWEYSETSND